MRRTAGSGTPPDVIILNVDNFKALNDTFGHSARDTMLSNIAELLRSGSRAGGASSRYGGAVFTMVMRKVTRGSTHAGAELLRREVKQLEARYEIGVLGRIAGSADARGFSQHGSSPAATLLQATGSTLYSAMLGSLDCAAVAPAI